MFSCWSTISTSSFGNHVHLINPFIDVWTLVFRFMSSLHLPNIYPLSDILLEKIFSHTLVCGHIWLCTLLSRVLNNCWSPFQNDFQILKCYKLKEIWFLWLVILYVFLKHWQTIKIRFSLLIYIFFLCVPQYLCRYKVTTLGAIWWFSPSLRHNLSCSWAAEARISGPWAFGNSPSSTSCLLVYILDIDMHYHIWYSYELWVSKLMSSH